VWSTGSGGARPIRIVILNWRDTCSPRSGGAERVTHDVAKGLAARGHEVTWFSSRVDGRPDEESLDGVSIVRRGGEATTRLYAPRFVRRLAPDVVLEEINTLPYLAPLWCEQPVLLYMNQLAREVWFYEAPFPIALAGWASEPLYLRAYRQCDAITISRSSRDDFSSLGFGGRITVTPLAVDAERALALSAKPHTGALIAIGRLTPSKRYDDAIRALAELRVHRTAATLTLIGDGKERGRLEQLADRLGVSEAVTFLGRASETEKLRALDDADVLVGTSVREGWGLTVTEAAMRGTPSVVYDIPGFRDAVIPGRTGLLVEQDPSSLARGVESLLDDVPLFERMRTAAWQTAAPSGHAATVDAFEAALRAVLTDRLRG